MRSKNAQSKSVVDSVQRYLNKDANKVPRYFQMGWLDRIGYGHPDSPLTSFHRQRFRKVDAIYDVHGFDHLVTFGTIECWIKGPKKNQKDANRWGGRNCSC